MEQFLIAVHILLSLGIIVLVLLQQGKGADMGASFGAGASQTLFGAAGGGNVLSHATGILAALFFATSLGLGMVAKHKVGEAGDAGVPSAEVIQSHNEQAAKQEPDVPVTPALDASAPVADVPAVPAVDAAASSSDAPSAPAGDAPASPEQKKN